MKRIFYFIYYKLYNYFYKVWGNRPLEIRNSLSYSYAWRATIYFTSLFVFGLTSILVSITRVTPVIIIITGISVVGIECYFLSNLKYKRYFKEFKKISGRKNTFYGFLVVCWMVFTVVLYGFSMVLPAILNGE